MRRQKRRLSISRLLVIAIMFPIVITSARLTVAQMPISDLREEYKTLISAIETQSRALSKPKRSAALQNKEFATCLLKAGQCDKAYDLLEPLMTSPRRQPFSLVELYCFEMALENRADEISAKVDIFRDYAGVRRHLRDEECDFDHLCEVPTRHGTAIRHVINGDLEKAAAEIKAIKKLERFGGEYDEIIPAAAFEVMHVMGPKQCVTFLESFANGNERKFRSLIRSTVIELDGRDQSNPLLFELLPDHVDTFRHEVWAATGSFNGTKESIPRLVEFVMAKLPELDDQTAFEVAAQLVQAERLTSKQTNQLVSDYIQTVESNPTGKHGGVIRQIGPWLIRNGKLKELQRLVAAFKPKDKYRYAYTIGGILKEVRFDADEEWIVRLAKLLPDPEEIPGKANYKSDVCHLLTELMQFEVANKWLDAIKDDKKTAGCKVKLDLYQLITSLKGTSPDEIAESIGSFLATADKSLFGELYFRRHLLANVAKLHGAQAVWATTNKLPKSMLRNTTPLNACVAALVFSGQPDLIMDVVRFVPKQQLSKEKLSSRSPSVVPFYKLDSALLDELGKVFQGSVYLLRERCRNAIKNNDQSTALRLHQELISKFNDNVNGRSFAKAGWEDAYLTVTKRIANSNVSNVGERNRLVQWGIYNVVSSIANERSLEEAIEIVENHVGGPADQIRVYRELTDSLVNPSTIIWRR